MDLYDRIAKSHPKLEKGIVHCPTSRALCNAGWAAVQAREASDE